MPLFEYACRACGTRFEHLVRAGAPAACPSCASRDLEKQLSVFAVAAAPGPAMAERTASAPCGACGDPRGPGSCSIN